MRALLLGVPTGLPTAPRPPTAVAETVPLDLQEFTPPLIPTPPGRPWWPNATMGSPRNRSMRPRRVAVSLCLKRHARIANDKRVLPLPRREHEEQMRSLLFIMLLLTATVLPARADMRWTSSSADLVKGID